MTEKIRNIAIALAVLVLAGTYAYNVVSSRQYYQRLDKARAECGQDYSVAKYDDEFKACLRRKGFDT